jgi:hypothetical protein
VVVGVFGASVVAVVNVHCALPPIRARPPRPAPGAGPPPHARMSPRECEHVLSSTCDAPQGPPPIMWAEIEIAAVFRPHRASNPITTRAYMSIEHTKLALSLFLLRSSIPHERA